MVVGPPVLSELALVAEVLALLDELPPELQAARVAPAAQHAIAIATRAAGRLRAGLSLAWLINSLTVLPCSGLLAAPLGDAPFGASQQSCHDDRGHREDGDSDEHLAGLEVLASGHDEATDTAVAEEVLGDDDADQ